jgi:hypothetical protein
MPIICGKNISLGKKVDGYSVNCCGKKKSQIEGPGVKINYENCKKYLITTGSSGPFSPITYTDCGNNPATVSISEDINITLCGSNFPSGSLKVTIQEIGYC